MAQFDASQIKKIAVLTSGGDAPGMNAAIRAVVRDAICHNLEVVGVRGGYQGLIDKNWQKLDLRSVANMIQRGGTFLKSGRCLEFLRPEVRSQCVSHLRSENIDALVCIGGDGSLTGAHTLWEEHAFPSVGVPGTIDNDIFGTDETIGFDTAVNTALEAIDRVRDTAASHDRLFIVEVMGRNSGFIATAVGLAGGAEDVFIPELPYDLNSIVTNIERGLQRGKKSSILIAAEGQKAGRAYDLAEALRNKAKYEARVCILGHIQRGGAPTAKDRILASRLGTAAVEALLSGQCDIMAGLRGDVVCHTDLIQCIKQKKPVDKSLISLIKVLAN